MTITMTITIITIIIITITIVIMIIIIMITITMIQRSTRLEATLAARYMLICLYRYEEITRLARD